MLTAAVGALAVAGASALPAQAMALEPGWQISANPGMKAIDVPAGAMQIQFVVVGGRGGGARGGRGAVVSGTVDVAGAKSLFITVGANGGAALTGDPGAGATLPGAGGGDSSVRLCESPLRRCRLAGLAGGGGGSGAGTSAFGVAAGGDAGASGEAGQAGPAPSGQGGGGAAGSTAVGGAGGAGGVIPVGCGIATSGPVGQPGESSAGGRGGGFTFTGADLSRSGGEGGDGLFGGGGGGAASACDGNPVGGAGGGGGGSSLIPIGGTMSLDDGATPGPSVRWFVVVERTAPEVTVTTPADGATYRMGAVVRAAFSCGDEAGGSGLTECTGTVAPDVSIDTSRPGRRSFTVTARDAAGNVTVKTVTYTVAAPVVAVRGLMASASAVRFTLSTPARVTLRVERRKPGRRGRWAAVGTIRRAGRTGFNVVRLNGRVGGRKLAAGTYRVTVTATADGRRSRPATKRFTVRAASARRRGRSRRAARR